MTSGAEIAKDANSKGQIDIPDSLDKDRLREIMIFRGLGYTQDEIAEEVGVSQKTVSRYLSEVKELTKEHPPKAVYYGLFINMFADKVTEVLTLLLDVNED